jgi:hypothetical protein
MPIGLGAAVVGAAAVGTAGSMIASSNATNAATNAANQNNALETSIYNQNSANAQPYIQAGDTANTELQGFLGLGGSPQATSTAFNNYLNSTGYQFNLNQGENAVTQSQAASGMLGSGATMEALDNYATGEADQYGQQYEQDLSGVASTGEGAANGLASTGQSYANAVSNNNNSAASASANAGLSASTGVNSLIGNALTAYGKGQGATSFASGASAGGNALVGG